MFTNICRLCLTPDDLIWIFDKKIAEPENMRNVISITTGVEIKSTDMVSQKVCKKCCQITIKMFKFRTTAIKNDRELKNRLAKITNNRENGKNRQANTISDKANVCRAAPPPVVYTKAHESVIKLSDQYAGLKIPRSCIECDVNPSVVVDPDEVRKWFEAKKKRDLENELKRKKDEDREEELEAEKFYIIKKTSKCNQNCIESDEESDSDVIVVDEPPPETSTKANISHFAPITAKRRLISVESPPPKRKASVDATSISSHDQDDEVCSNSSVSEKSSVSPVGGLLLSTVNESRNVHVCQICNAVIYSNKEMKNHVRKHTMCPFCKIRFRTLEAKNIHVEKECPIRSIIENPPSIPLVKVDEDKDITDKYPSVFAPIQDSSSDTVNEAYTTVGGVTSVEAERNKPVAEIDTTVDDDVTYISDDDDDDPVIVSDDTPLRNVIKIPEPVKEISGPRPEITKIKTAVSQPKIPKFDMPGDEVLKGLDLKDNEATVLKNLLKLVDKHQILTKPTNADNISVQGHNDKTYSLKNIVPYLRKYKIPIELEYAHKLSVQYEDVTPSCEKVKNLWDPHGASMQRFILPKPVTELNDTPEGLRNKPNTKQPAVAQNKQSIPSNSSAGSLTLPSIAILSEGLQNKLNTKQPAVVQNKQSIPSSSSAGSLLNVNQTIPSTAILPEGLQSKPNTKQPAVVQNNQSNPSSSARSFLKVNHTIPSTAILAAPNQVASPVNILPQRINTQEAPVVQVNNVVSLQETPLTQMNMLQTPQINIPPTQTVSQLNCMVPVQTPIVSSIHTTPLSQMSHTVLQTSQNSVVNNQTVVLNSMLNQLLSSPGSNAGNNYIPRANANIVSAPPLYQYGYVSSVNSANANTVRPPPPYSYNYVSSASSAISTDNISRPLYTTHSTNSSVLINNSASMMRPPVILNNENIGRQTIRVKTISELNRRE